MKLKNRKKIGRYTQKATGRTVNIWFGVKHDNSGHVRYYIRRGTRFIISNDEFYNEWELHVPKK
jgi:hypothetical protein